MRLIIRDLRKIVEQKAVLDEASYSFKHGKVYGLVGARDEGKKALIDVIASEARYESGSIKIEADWKEHRIRYSDIGIVSGNQVLPEYMTGVEFIKSFVEVNKDVIDTMDNYNALFDTYRITEEVRNTLIKDYTLSDRIKLQMMSMKLLKPSILIFDEAINSDSKVKLQLVKKTVEELKKDRIIIFSTENIALATELCDEYLIIDNGIIRSMEADKMVEFIKAKEEGYNA